MARGSLNPLQIGSGLGREGEVEEIRQGVLIPFKSGLASDGKFSDSDLDIVLIPFKSGLASDVL